MIRLPRLQQNSILSQNEKWILVCSTLNVFTGYILLKDYFQLTRFSSYRYVISGIMLFCISLLPYVISITNRPSRFWPSGLRKNHKYQKPINTLDGTEKGHGQSTLLVKRTLKDYMNYGLVLYLTKKASRVSIINFPSQPMNQPSTEMKFRNMRGCQRAAGKCSSLFAKLLKFRLQKIETYSTKLHVGIQEPGQ